MSTAIDPIKIVDLSLLVDLQQAAKVAAFHHPDLLTIDAGVRDKILSYIEQTPGFSALVTCLAEQGVAQTPDSDYEGWANGTYLTDSQGQTISDGNGGHYWIYRYTPDTKAALRPVIQQALLAVRSDPDLQGIRYEAPVSELPSPVLGTRGFVLDRQGWESGYQAYLDNASLPSATIRLANQQFRYTAVYQRFIDAQGSPISLGTLSASDRPTPNPLDTSLSSFLGWLAPRPLILGTPLPAETSAAFTLRKPGNASSIDLLLGSYGRGDAAAGPAAEQPLLVPGALLTSLSCFCLPALYLSCGITTEQIQAEMSGVLADFASYLVTLSSRPDVQQLFQSATRGTTPDTVNTDLGYALLGVVVKDQSPALTKVVKWLGSQSLNELCPIMGTMLEAISTVQNVADLAGAGAYTCQSPWVVQRSLSTTVDVQVTAQCAANSYQFPATARKYEMTAQLPGQAPVTLIQSDFPSPTASTITGTLAGLPPAVPVAIGVRFASATNATAGEAYSTLRPLGTGGTAAVVQITENAVVPNSSSQYVHRQKLVAGTDGKHRWDVTSPAPSATQAQLGGNMAVTLEDLTFLNLAAKGRLAYGWRGKSPGLPTYPTGAVSNPLSTMQSVSLAGSDPDAQCQMLPSGFSAPVLLACNAVDPDSNLQFAIAPAINPRSKQPEYHVRRVDLNSSGDFGLPSAASWGRLASPRLSSVTVHPSGVVVGLSSSNDTLAILRVPSSPYLQDDQAEYALQAAGQGTAAGLLHGAKAVAVSSWADNFFVLEQVNQRVQAFDLSGNPLRYFGPSAFLNLAQWPEDTGKTITYLDLKVSPSGYFFILSLEDSGSTSNQYRLDLYAPDGSKLSRTRGVVAARIAVDSRHAVYTLNYELMIGANQRPEPSVSLWALG